MYFGVFYLRIKLLDNVSFVRTLVVGSLLYLDTSVGLHGGTRDSTRIGEGTGGFIDDSTEK